MVSAFAHHLAEARARPRRLVLLALVAGLLTTLPGPVVGLVVAALGAVLAGRPRASLVVAAAVLAGAWIGGERLAAVRASALRPLFGRELSTRAVLLEPPRARRFGSTGLARLEEGPGSGEKVVLAGSRWGGGRLAGEVGDETRVRGEVRTVPPWLSYEARRGAHAELLVREARPTGRRRGGPLGAVDGIRRHAESALTGRLPAEEGALLRGMVLGEDDALPDDLRTRFRTVGLSHIVAASGQNVMLLCALAVPLFAGLGLGLRARMALLLVLIALYVPLAGGGPSIQRAGLMGAVGVLGILAGRPRDRWYGLGLAALVTLIVSPLAATDPGWQLSFAAVISMWVLAPRIAARLEAKRCARVLAQALGLTLAATVGTAPLLALHFGRVSVVSLPVNVLAAPVVAVTMWIGMGAAVLAQLTPAAGELVAAVATPLLGFLTSLAHAGSAIPHAQVALRVGVLGAFIAYALLVAVVLIPRVRRPVGLAAAITAVGALAWPARALPSVPPGAVRVSFLDVGQGDATLVQSGGRAVLVDAGPPDGPILQRLHEAGVGRLDLAVVTHAQADHEGGMAAVVREHPVGLLLDGGAGASTPEHRALAALSVNRHVRRVVPDAGQVLSVGPIRVTVLSPRAEPAALHAGQDPNVRAIVAQVSVGTWDLLLPADAESDVTSTLPLAPVEALKVAHHGSVDPGLPDLLARLRPEVAVVEVGRHNSYGHPAPATVAELRTVPHVFRTDRDGTVTITVVAASGRSTVRTAR